MRVCYCTIIYLTFSSFTPPLLQTHALLLQKLCIIRPEGEDPEEKADIMYILKSKTGKVSKLVFYAQSTGAVISGR